MKLPLLLALTALSLGTTPCPAQDTYPSVGFGAGLDLTPTDGFSLLGGLDFSGRPGNIMVPVRVTRRLRVEPRIGYVRETDDETTSTSTTSQHASLLRLSLGIYYLFPASRSFTAYAGPQLGVRHRSASLRSTLNGSQSSNSASSTDTFLGIATGGEYYFVPQFSLGAEIELVYTFRGDVHSVTSPPPPVPAENPRIGGSMLETSSQVMIRWFPGLD